MQDTIDRLYNRLGEFEMLCAVFEDALENDAAAKQAMEAHRQAADAHGSNLGDLVSRDALTAWEKRFKSSLPPLKAVFRLLSEAPAPWFPPSTTTRAASEEQPCLLSSVPPALAEVRTGPFTFTLSITMPWLYPDLGPLEWSVESPVTKEQRDAILEAVNETLSANQGLPCAHGVLEAARDRMLEVRASEAEEDVEEYNRRLLDSTAADTALDVQHLQDDVIASERRLGRRAVYFHHILSVAKRQCIARWARVLRLRGFSKIGYPGILIVEGPEIGVQEYIRGLQRLRWKLMVVRGEEVVTARELGLPPNATLDDMRAIRGGGDGQTFGVIEMTSSSDIAECCHQCGLTALFRTSMKIYQ